MTVKLTRTEVISFINETVREELLEKKFDPSILSNMKFPNEQAMTDFVYYKMKLKPLGGGSARIVYFVDSKRVLKVADNKAGIAQNLAEVAGYNNPTARPLFTKIYRYDPNGKWVLAELVRPLSSEDEFEKLTGTPWDIFKKVLSYNLSMSFDIIRQAVAEKHWEYSDYDSVSIEKILSSPFLITAVRAMISLDDRLMPADLKKVSHWGKTPDQRVVLLDYGFTAQVYDDHY